MIDFFLVSANTGLAMGEKFELPRLYNFQDRPILVVR